MNSKEFSLKIENVVKEKRMFLYGSRILYCEELEVDPGTVSNLISKSLKEKIKLEAHQFKDAKIS
jgi:hypothetical protein